MHHGASDRSSECRRGRPSAPLASRRLRGLVSGSASCRDQTEDKNAQFVRRPAGRAFAGRAARRRRSEVLTEKLKGGAAIKVAKALIARKLMREVKAKPGMPVWRRDAEGRPFSLVISSAGRKAIGVTEKDVESATNIGDPARSSSSAISVGHRSERISRRKTATPRDAEQVRACSRVFGAWRGRRHEEGASDRDVEWPGGSVDRCADGRNRMASPYHPCGADWIAPCRLLHRAVQERRWRFGLSAATRSRISRERQCCIGSAPRSSRSGMTVMADRTNVQTANASETPAPVAFEAKSLQQEIAQLRDLDLDGLRLRWRNLFGRTAPAHLPKFLLLRIIAYRMQANVLWRPQQERSPNA